MKPQYTVIYIYIYIRADKRHDKSHTRTLFSLLLVELLCSRRQRLECDCRESFFSSRNTRFIILMPQRNCSLSLSKESARKKKITTTKQHEEPYRGMECSAILETFFFSSGFR